MALDLTELVDIAQQIKVGASILFPKMCFNLADNVINITLVIFFAQNNIAGIEDSNAAIQVFWKVPVFQLFIADR